MNKAPGSSKKQLATLAGMRVQTANKAIDRMVEELKANRTTWGEYDLVDRSLLEQAEAECDEREAAVVEPELHEHAAPLGYHLVGVSTLNVTRDVFGKVTQQQWVKTKKTDAATPEELLEAFQRAVASRDILAKPAAYLDPTVERLAHRICVYPMGDPHLGMLAWAAETGEDFDLATAESLLYGAVDRLVALAPATKKCLLISLGDFFHFDNLDGVSRRSGHTFDTAARWSKVFPLGVGLACRMIDRCLEKHEEVHVILEIGNHDDHSSLMLAVCLAHHYRNEPRVHIDTSPSTFHWFEFGKVLIGTTHGQDVKGEKLPGVMAADQPEAWGRTKHRYWYVGHVHHEDVKEYPGCVVKYHRTVAAKDAWHHSKGYRAGRSMSCDVMDEDYGLVMTHQVGVEEIRRSAT